MRKIIIAVAPVGPATLDAVENPLSPEEIAEQVVSCTLAGASMVHLHVRDTHGEPTADLTALGRTLDRIRAESDIIVQGSTGGVSTLSLQERCAALGEPRVEVASLNMGSVNMDDGVYANALPDIRYWATRMREARVHPELEVFEGGMIHNARLLTEEGYLEAPHAFGLALGFRGALPATPESLIFLRNLLPDDAAWGLVHHGMRDLSLLAMAAGMGASVLRVGFEDSVYYAPERRAQTNTELVCRLVDLVEAMGLAIASPSEGRDMLGLDHISRAER